MVCDSKNKSYVSVSAVISIMGYLYFEVRESEGFKQMGLVRFLNNAWANICQKILVVWDNAPSHHSKTIKAFLASQNKDLPRIWLENIPAYSPELNPIEQLWACLKKRLSNQFFKTTSELKKAVIKTLDEIANDKELIQSFFKNKELNCYEFNN